MQLQPLEAASSAIGSRQPCLLARQVPHQNLTIVSQSWLTLSHMPVVIELSIYPAIHTNLSMAAHCGTRPGGRPWSAGAIFGLGSATALFVHRHRRNDEQFSSTLLKGLGSSLLINVVIGLSVPSIDNWCVDLPLSHGTKPTCVSLLPMLQLPAGVCHRLKAWILRQGPRWGICRRCLGSISVGAAQEAGQQRNAA